MGYNFNPATPSPSQNCTHKSITRGRLHDWLMERVIVVWQGYEDFSALSPEQPWEAGKDWVYIDIRPCSCRSVWVKFQGS